VTLKSDLAFAKNSAELSGAAKVAVAKIARQVRRAKLKGTIEIHGYTDNLGSAAHGLELSRQRAQAVAQYLRGALGGYEIEIAAFGHGEANPIASNATEAGRQKNRRVTITLPKP
jgi:outer membrane protein OmpA-like peptidoglycan-associated protein